MKTKIYSIKDTKIGYMSPMYLQNDGVAIREFTNARNSTQQNIVNTNPEDKELWALGEFDDQTGTIVSDVRFIIKAEDVFTRKGE